MVLFGFDEKKLKVYLKMNVERLKLQQSKKTNILKVKKREIAKLLEQGKDESARVMVEHVIREDFVVEAYEILEVHTQLLLARMGVIEEEKLCPEDLREAICSLIYAETRCSEITELEEIKRQFGKKYGKEFVEHASEYANRKIVSKLSIRAPEETLIVSYLNEIAQVFGVDWHTELEKPPIGLSTFPDTMGGGDGGGDGGGGNLAAFHNTNFIELPPPTFAPVLPSASATDNFGDLPSIPTKPATDDGGVPSFDDLAARFEALKRK